MILFSLAALLAAMHSLVGILMSWCVSELVSATLPLMCAMPMHPIHNTTVFTVID
jgi:hypothetical protein